MTLFNDVCRRMDIVPLPKGIVGEGLSYKGENNPRMNDIFLHVEGRRQRVTVERDTVSAPLDHPVDDEWLQRETATLFSMTLAFKDNLVAGTWGKTDPPPVYMTPEAFFRTFFPDDADELAEMDGEDWPELSPAAEAVLILLGLEKEAFLAAA